MKTSIEVMKIKCASFGHTFISGSPGSTSKINVACNVCGHIRAIRYDSLLRDPKCPGCKHAVDAETSKKELLKFLPSGYSVVGYRVLHEPISVICNKGHYTTVLPLHIKRVKKYKCPVCAKEAKDYHKTEGLIKELRDNGWSLISGSYTGPNSKFVIKCSLAGHAKEIIYRSRAHYIKPCYQCELDKKRQAYAKNFSDSLRTNGIELVSEYTNEHSKLLIKCSKNHLVESTGQSLVKSFNCPTCVCSSQTSSGEKEISDFVESFNVIVNKRMKVDKLEFDIVLPEYKLAIEYHGLYWHSYETLQQRFQRPIQYHKIKNDVALKNGLLLLQIWEDEWKNRKEIVKSIIMSKIGKNKTIYARNCNILELNKEQALAFFSGNHLQGGGQSNIKTSYGLIYNEQLVMAVSIADHHRHHNQVVINRVCTKVGFNVVGGFSKLLQRLPRPLITWSDNRYSNGQIYEKLGFKLDAELPPDYQYAKGGKRFSKQSLKKTQAEKSSGKTEAALRAEQGFLRIYDAGKKRWVLY